MATFGNISAPESWLPVGAADVVCSTFVLSEAADVASISCQLNLPDADYAEVRFLIYTSLGVLVASSADVWDVPASGQQLVTIALVTSLPAGTYKLAVQIEHDSIQIGRVLGVSGAGIQVDDTNTWAAGAPDPFVEAYTRPENEQVCIYATYTAASSPILSTLDAAAAVGGTGYSGTTANMAAITSLTNATITGTSTNAFTYSMNGWVHGGSYLRPTGSPTFTASDGTLSATKASPLAPMAGYTAVTVASILRNEWTIGQDTNILDTDVLCLPTAMGTVNPDTSLTDAVFGTWTMWRWEAATGIMYTSQLTVSESGVSEGMPQQLRLLTRILPALNRR